MVPDFQATFLDYLAAELYRTFVFSSTISRLQMAIVLELGATSLVYEPTFPYYHKMVPDYQVRHPCYVATYLDFYPTYVFS
jgi:hypothetical protein